MEMTGEDKGRVGALFTGRDTTRTIRTSHPLATAIEERPEVHSTYVLPVKDAYRVLVTFEGWSVPFGFFDDYDLEPQEFYIRDGRSIIQRLLGQPGWPKMAVSATYDRDSDPLDLMEDEA